MFTAVNYHYIRDNFEYAYPSIFGATPTQFERQLRRLAQLGNYVSQAQLRDAITRRGKLAPNSLLVTFDDGLKEQFALAYPILKRLGIPFVCFVNARTLVEDVVMNVHKIHMVRSVVSPEEIQAKLEQFTHAHGIYVDVQEAREKGTVHYKYDTPVVGQLKYSLNFMLTSEQQDALIDYLFANVFEGQEKAIHDKLYFDHQELTELARAGYIGSHGYDHKPLGMLPATEQDTMVGLSKEVIEHIAQVPIYGFSYPYGSKEASAGMANHLERHGYTYSFTMERAINKDLTSPFYLSRFDNNDMPLGKNYKFDSDEYFEHLPRSSWFEDLVAPS